MQEQQYEFGSQQRRKSPGSQSRAQTMQMQVTQNIQECAVKHPPANALARNRRYCKLKSLWKQGYFEEQSIMLRFPTLYFQYVGQFKKDSKEGFSTISQFLEKQIISTQYRRLLQQSQLKDKMENQQSQMQEENAESQSSPFEQKLSQLKPIDLQMQEQALIDEIQSQFIEGNLPGFDYHQIDEDNQLDNRKILDEDGEEKYFAQQDQEERDPSTNTGVQDF